MQVIEFSLNGKNVSARCSTDTTLLSLLRNNFHLTGTKEGCCVGECGACTVLLNGRPVNSCLVLALSVAGQEVLTIEGLASDQLHPLQEAFIEAGAVQCGYCTPGMILSAKALIDSNPHPDPKDITEAISGNLCRCTGYAKIIDAVVRAAERMSQR